MTARIGSFSRNSENRMLFAIAARIGTDPGGMTGRARLSATRYGYRDISMKSMRYLSAHWISAYAFNRVSQTNIKPTYAERGCVIQPLQLSLKTRSNKISIRAHRRGFGPYILFDLIRIVATNGQPIIRLPSAQARAQYSTRSPNLLLTGRGPAILESIAKYAPHTCPTNIPAGKRERVGMPCLEFKSRDRKVTSKRNRSPKLPVDQPTSGIPSYFV
jgi:hypothetical protein